MDDNSQVQKPIHQKSPTELLIEQTQSSSELVQINKIQREQVGALLQQNKVLLRQLEETQSRTHVKIEDINMPLGAMVGLMLKVSFAAIPAGIVLGSLYFLVVTVIIGGFFGSI
ncbi:MAG: hypothetical protein WAV05_19665 [Anaerolineales bacterium]